MPVALISVSDKTGAIDLASALYMRGYVIVSTGGTAKTLVAAGLPVTKVSDVTGFPEILEGRVKTLHPNIHGGILARRSNSGDMYTIGRHQITPIDIVAVNLYPFAHTVEKPNINFGDLIEEIDVGGPTMVRAAAKNFEDVLVIVEPHDYSKVITELDKHGGPSLEFRFELAKKAFAHTAAYDKVIAEELSKWRFENGKFVR